MSRWTNVPGCLTIEVAKYEDGWFDLNGGEIAPEIGTFIERELPGSLWCSDLVVALGGDPDSFLVEIDFLSSGYYEPAQTSGPPERCYPEEGSDERVLDTIKISPPIERGYNSAAGRRMSQEEAEQVVEFYQTQIDDVELDTQDY